MSKYIPKAEIPPRGNVLTIPIEYLISIRQMPEDARLQFFTAQIDWMLTGADPDVLEGCYRTMFDRWTDHQQCAADRARETQAARRNAGSRGAEAGRVKQRMPPPMR